MVYQFYRLFLIYSTFKVFSVLVFASIHYKNSNPNNFVEQFIQITIIINLIVVVKIFEATYIDIFYYLLDTKFYKNGLLKPILIILKQ